MPKRTDIKKILIIGSGPIIIGQACEFDYSGTQACKALKEEGYEVVLVNSNPASIMTDPEFADRTYIEPINPEMIEKIIEKERPDALLPTIGGQTALNNAVALADKGVLDKYGVELIGAKLGPIKKAEDRELFKKAMQKIGIGVPESAFAYTVDDAVKISETIGFPLIIRPAFTLGGTGGGVAYNLAELKEIVHLGLSESPISQVLVEQSVLGWKEYELEVMRDLKDNVVIVCSIENFDPMGIHTGDSITVAPAQTLTDKEYQQLRDYSLAVIREIGVDTGGSNIQFAVNPDDGKVIIIEMNPRVSRSSALASKATGFPIAKIAAKLAVGYTLDEISNDITEKTPACFEPTIDYVVTKIPRFAFEKFPQADATLNTTMKSVGETMAIGRTFKESLQKALRSLEIGVNGFDYPKDRNYHNLDEKLSIPNAERIFFIKEAFYQGYSIEDVFNKTKIDRWFLDNLFQLFEVEKEMDEAKECPIIDRMELLKKLKKLGFSDKQIAKSWGFSELEIRRMRMDNNIIPVYKTVDTCAAEFEAFTPYYYSTYEEEDEVIPSEREKIMILGGGPNRIGQGIEFDYCCVHASFALREDGYETIMVNSNPETVSTDYDTSDRLYFEPVTYEDVLTIVEKEKPKGVIVQFGGQTPLKLAIALKKAGVPIIGTDPDDIDVAEDRERFGALLKELQILQPYNGTARSFEDARAIAHEIGYPVMVRPSYVLGGRAMEIVFDERDLERYIKTAVEVSPEHPILIDKFLEDAIEIDVDAVSDGKRCVIAGIMEHIEEAGIHSGDSACVLPTFSIGEEIEATIKANTYKLAQALRVVGLMNIQYAIKNDKVFVLEVNPRASRTVPFVSKATGVQWAKIAARVMAGKTLDELGVTEVVVDHVSVKEAVLPFSKFSRQDTILGPEMKSTGEVMGIASSLGNAFAKAQIAAGASLPGSGCVFISVREKDKRNVVNIGKRFENLGYKIFATRGTAKVLKNNGIDVIPVLKVHEGRPNIDDVMKNGEIDIIVNTPQGKGSRIDDKIIRGTALLYKIFSITTLSGANAVLNALESIKKYPLEVQALQDYYKKS
ncbi:MAG: carbamoyl phosphate synthase large subunit [Candidatus Margulisiibacteriota bacterium]|nr:MAG: carbamoyl phosphate synthase large subunit [Candidatus Margulisbacteria bacterium GWD2_39_127]OGI03676.1 MAG: carbamoyl phosphate synthase large subunit [Candidatus Margulisbacteria bacterium GWF2_38_17]OGI05668.1 MAG: carbamoyl phosphate synthase large subunit [Candidatus Margulisbacteria bacterium GWE2_39_32]PZM82220.1 MAG: carbamoyl phosphate synthase large subunit [Candidatus Margulisiibacteriota bacterium]HAR63739.1 carbamoyl phosphate synthase large subunit [Candidatus Margulisiib